LLDSSPPIDNAGDRKVGITKVGITGQWGSRLTAMK
jgi:hypothetical protein